jgi:hypothetical protein
VITSIDDLVAFLKRFHRHWSDHPGLDPVSIPIDLPPGLATIYRELGELVEMKHDREHGSRTPFNAQDRLLPPSQLERAESMVVFAWENQGCWSARFPPGLADPPVYSNSADVWDPPQKGFVMVCKSLNHFLTTLCLQEAVMSCRNLVSLDEGTPWNRALKTPLQPLWLGGYLASGEPTHNFYVSADGEVLLMDCYGWPFVGSPSRAVVGLVADGVGIQEIA